jgi:rod shape-determining protein MreD
MRDAARLAALVGFGILLLLLQVAWAALAPTPALSPYLLVPLVIYLGVSQDVHVVFGASIAFVLGYFLDGLSGYSLGAQAFVLVATFMTARGAGLRLFLRGPLFQVLLTFVAALAWGAALVALRAVFEPPTVFPAPAGWSTYLALVWPALLTAALAPLVFVAVRRLDGAFLHRRDDPGVLS